MFESLVTYMESLALAHTDDRSLGGSPRAPRRTRPVCLTRRKSFSSPVKPQLLLSQSGVLSSRLPFGVIRVKGTYSLGGLHSSL